MGLTRSEIMKYGMLVLPAGEARKVIQLIGKETTIQLEDMNANEMRRPYRKYVQRLDEMERILRFMYEEIAKVDGVDITKNRVEQFMENSDKAYQLDNVETELTKLYGQWMKFKDNNATLSNARNVAMEQVQVLGTAAKMLVENKSGGGNLEEPLLDGDASRRLSCVAGVVLKSDQDRLARALWRATRGNAYTQLESIDEKLVDPKTGAVVQKAVFVVYFQSSPGAGSQESAMHAKVVKVCGAFGVNMYDWPTSQAEAVARAAQLTGELAEKEQALSAFQKYVKIETDDLLALPNADANSKIEEWRLFCVKEKSIYAQLNMCQEGPLLRVNCWFPANDEQKIQQLLASQISDSGQNANLVPDKNNGKHAPPTYIKTNEYTQAFQDVINTYGIPRYQEFNPAVCAYVSFPFIFGMMYGDVGHGTLLFLAGCWMCKNSESLRFTQPALFTGRFMILQMGFFAIFAGFMYNDFFCLGMQLFDSGFEDKVGDGNYTPNYDVTNSGGPGPYPFGLDWAWAGAGNELLFVNSLKMKMSVLFGVLQMIVGVLLRWSNAIHERNWTDFIFECIPMMCFMLCFFGWMDVMILYKWVNPIDNPPNIINSMICMGMGQQDNMPVWDGSVALSKKLMIMTVISVPMICIPKPIILYLQHQKKAAQNGEHKLINDEETADASGGHGGHGEEFEIGEVVIHQVIETIEYVLGTVSHTASYLRIWALSLAHQQLSLVFFQKTITNGLLMAGPWNAIMLYFMFAMWFGITCGVLLGMDVLECFLHTLRLHWVEFQSKFYRADGYIFEPYSIKTLLEPNDSM